MTPVHTSRELNAEALLDMYKALKESAETVCGALCPSVKKTGEEWTHVERCRNITAAILKAEGRV